MRRLYLSLAVEGNIHLDVRISGQLPLRRHGNKLRVRYFRLLLAVNVCSQLGFHHLKLMLSALVDLELSHVEILLRQQLRPLSRAHLLRLKMTVRRRDALHFIRCFLFNDLYVVRSSWMAFLGGLHLT